MSCTRKIKIINFVKIEITCIDRNALAQIEEQAICALKQKLDKLNIIMKNLNVYCQDDVLLVNDRYGISKDFEEIAKAFGLEIKPVECALRGKSYILHDPLIDIIRQLNPTFSISEYANCKTTEVIQSIISENEVDRRIDGRLTQVLRKIKTEGRYTVSGQQEITKVYYDGHLRNTRKGAVTSQEKQVVIQMLEKYKNYTRNAINEANENLRDGTAKLLYSRARQMGYAVKEERKGNQVQLVLVRCE